MWAIVVIKYNACLKVEYDDKTRCSSPRKERLRKKSGKLCCSLAKSDPEQFIVYQVFHGTPVAAEGSYANSARPKLRGFDSHSFDYFPPQMSTTLFDHGHGCPTTHPLGNSMSAPIIKKMHGKNGRSYALLPIYCARL